MGKSNLLPVKWGFICIRPEQQVVVFAALMAKKGYTGTEEIFEGKEGLMDVYGPE